jgi:hypothetical protein
MIRKNNFFGLLAALLVILACNAPIVAPTVSVQPTATLEAVAPLPPVDTPVNSTATAGTTTHLQVPSAQVPAGKIVNDVESSGTGSDKRAPYGDSYDINLLERPFLQDMTYIPDLDIATFQFSQDETWHYVSIKLIGADPNHALGINYAVEIDTDKDGFGNFIIWASPSYTSEWTTENVRVFADTNHNTGGLSAIKSDAPFSSDGYETLVFDGANGVGTDPDLAWVRLGNSENATLQFAFKRLLAGDIFMAGVIADAGLKDVVQIDYVDRFTETEAGSPVKDKKYYPLQALFSVDNTCREAIGFISNGYEPRSCVKPEQVQDSSDPAQPPSDGCKITPNSCMGNTPYYWPFPHCACSSIPYTP